VDELDLAAHDLGIAEEIPLPELITEDHDGLWLLSGRRVGRNQPAAFQSGHAPVIGSVRGKVGGLDVFGKIAVGGGEVPPIHGDDKGSSAL
jgi:hypothetical protein